MLPRLSEQPKGLSSETSFELEGESSNCKGFCLHNRNGERSIPVILPELIIGKRDEMSCWLSDEFMKVLMGQGKHQLLWDSSLLS